MRVCVINLREAKERRREASRQLDRLGIDFELYHAAHGSLPIGSYFETFDPAAYRCNTLRDPLPGEIGCYASHLGLWKRCIETGEPLIVLEDDFELLPGFKAAIAAVETLITDHGFIRLESTRRRRRSLLKRLRPVAYELGSVGDFRLAYLSDVPSSLTAYAISPLGAARLVRASHRLIAPVDKFVQRTWEHETPIFALRPAVVRTSRHSARSTIGDRRSRKQRSSLRLLLARSAYKGVGELRRLKFDRTQLSRLGRGLPSRERDVGPVRAPGAPRAEPAVAPQAAREKPAP